MFQAMVRVFFILGFSAQIWNFSHSETNAISHYDCIVGAATENASNSDGYERLSSAPERIEIVVSECNSEGLQKRCSPGYLQALTLSPALFSEGAASSYEGSYGQFESEQHGSIIMSADRFYASLMLEDHPIPGERTALFATGYCTKNR